MDDIEAALRWALGLDTQSKELGMGQMALRVDSRTNVNWVRGNGQLADLTPLRGMKLAGLRELNLSWTKVDGSPISAKRSARNASTNWPRSSA